MKPFEIFRAGRHTSSQGAELTFGDSDLVAVVSGYDTAKHHAPIVVGHPKTDAPAYGWIERLELKGDRLVATPADVDTAFADLVRDKKYRKVSAAFYPPAAANNPTPGSYYLRHVGFLGAAAPAVKGLKPIEFSADDEIVAVEIEFAEDGWRHAWTLESIGRLFRGLRDHFIETNDKETADRLLPDWEISQLVQSAADMRAEARTDARPSFSDDTTRSDVMNDKTAAAIAELDERERKIAAREATFAEQEKKRRDGEDAAFVDSVVQAGRLPKGLQAQATALFCDLGEDEITFSDDSGAKKLTARDAFRDLLGKLPVPVVTGEIAKGDAIDFSDPDAVSAAIAAQIKEAAARGETLSPVAAAARIQGSK